MAETRRHRVFYLNAKFAKTQRFIILFVLKKYSLCLRVSVFKKNPLCVFASLRLESGR